MSEEPAFKRKGVLDDIVFVWKDKGQQIISSARTNLQGMIWDSS